MDDKTAFDLIGKTASLIIDGRRIEDVKVTGNQIPLGGPGYIDLRNRRDDETPRTVPLAPGQRVV